MVETRAAPRFRAVKPVRIEYGGDEVACKLHDLSVTGASLEVFDPAGIPVTFTLIVPEFELKVSCRIVRRTDFRIGVAFE